MNEVEFRLQVDRLMEELGMRRHERPKAEALVRNGRQVGRLMKELGLTPGQAEALVEYRRQGRIGAAEWLRKDGYWKTGGAGGKAVGSRRKAKVEAAAPKTAEPRRKKSRKSGSLSHGTRPETKGKRGQSGKVTPIE